MVGNPLPCSLAGSKYVDLVGNLTPNRDRVKGRRGRTKHVGPDCRAVRSNSGRLRCYPCENRANGERYRNYQREYQERLRRRRGVRDSKDGSREYQRFIDYLESSHVGHLTVRELSCILGVSEHTIRGWVRKKWLDTEVIFNDSGEGRWRKKTLIVLT